MSKTGLTAIFNKANAPLEIREMPVVSPQGDSVRLKLYLSGICGTDVHIHQGKLALPAPVTPGHEFIGIIEETGPEAKQDSLGNKLKTGDMAICCVAVPCGKCFNCKNGETANCLNFGVTYIKDPKDSPHFFGGYSEYLFSPAKNLISIPADIDVDAVAAFACAGPTGIHAFNRAGGINTGELVVIQGSGPVGLFACVWAAQAGAHVILIGSGAQEKRMELAKQLGAETVLDYKKVSPKQRLEIVQQTAKDMGRADGADIVFEATGVPQAVTEGLNMVRTLGKYIIPGQYSESGTIELAPQMITFKAINIIGSSQYMLSDISEYLTFLAKHKDIQPVFSDCISHRYKISQANEAMNDAAGGKIIKGVFCP